MDGVKLAIKDLCDLECAIMPFSDDALDVITAAYLKAAPNGLKRFTLDVSPIAGDQKNLLVLLRPKTVVSLYPAHSLMKRTSFHKSSSSKKGAAIYLHSFLDIKN